jgi:hypothetical protein
MTHNLKTVTPSQRQQAFIAATVLIGISILIFFVDFKTGAIVLSLSLAVLAMHGWTKLVRYDDKREVLEIREYCFWFPGGSIKEIARKDLREILHIIDTSKNTAAHEIAIVNTANEYVCCWEISLPAEEEIARVARILDLNVIQERL